MKKKIRNGIALLCAMVFLQFYLPVAACNTAYAEKKTNEPVLELDESYEIESNTASASNSKKKEYTVAVKKSIKLSVSTKKTVKWSSSNKKIATVSSNGVVKGKKAGTVTITAKYGSKKTKFTVIVTRTFHEYTPEYSSPEDHFS